jgi:imidazolonepropionase-like amidohydrolase
MTSEPAKIGAAPAQQAISQPPARLLHHILIESLPMPCARPIFLVVAFATTLIAQRTTAIVGAKLIDGFAATPLENSVVIIQDGHIRAAGPRAQVRIPANCVRIDGTGKVIVPGLIDIHCHYAAPLVDINKYYSVLLRWGVTTIRNAGTDAPDAVAKMHQFRDGKLRGPRVYTSGFGFSHPQGAPRVSTNINRPSDTDEARIAVRTLAAQKVDFIKIWVEGGGGGTPKIRPEIRAAIVDEAAKHRLPVLAHVTALEDLRQLADLGVTDFLHTPGDATATQELIAYAKSKSLSFAPTLANMESGFQYYEKPELLRDPMIQGAFYPSGWARVTDAAFREKQLAAMDQRKERIRAAYRFIKAMSQGGVRIVTGSDTGAELSPVPFGAATHREIEMLVEAG